MSLFGLGAGFQTSFVVAALVAVIFLANRLGGDDEFLRRGLQVAIGFAAFLVILSATNAFIRAPDFPASESGDIFSSSDDNEGVKYLNNVATRASGAGTVHVAVGIMLAIFGAALWKRLKVIPIGLLFGGLLLLLFGAPPQPADSGDGLGAYYALVFSATGRSDQIWDIIRFLVLLGGTIGLLAYVYVRFEEPPSTRPEEQGPPKPPDEISASPA